MRQSVDTPLVWQAKPVYFKYPDPDSSGRAPVCVVPAYGYVSRERGKAADATLCLMERVLMM